MLRDRFDFKVIWMIRVNIMSILKIV
jgi:hypothetical protein